MKQTLKYGLAVAIALTGTASFTTLSRAADVIETQIIELPPQPVSTGGWYLRGDVGYSKAKFRDGKFPTYTLDKSCSGDPCVIQGDDGHVSGKLKGSFLVGGGVGYQVTDYFRTDLTLDYMTRSSFEGSRGTWCGNTRCTSSDSSKMSALSLMANAYVDIANINGVTPYVGAGIGGTYVKWGNVIQQNPGQAKAIEMDGASNWRFTWALMAGASYDLTRNLKLDAGYRFRHVNGGKMSEGAYSNGPTYDKGLNIHDVRVGLRYQFDN
ncbi:opacity protein-like surface antigen [Paenochrobactrum gallinarii]|uniref:Opacity protein-like surface antigen n=1 Tax=Paenochrobactrum gallinarii TaxID=643673 RepID=A0A841M4N5_9HYPH|nr:outer membrane protein [Paenochrobactrum gallinarii]MBB6261261.1 opacity protein-like surface antigen [Paenochrobactrum gallinarii]